MANESTKWLYDQLKVKGYNVGKDVTEFDNLMQTNAESRKWAYVEKPGRRDPRGRGRLTTGAEIRQTPNKQNKNDPCRNSCRQGIFM